jgi:hypothetical protein
MSTGAQSVNNASYFQAIVPGNCQRIDFSNASGLLPLAFDSGTTIIRLRSTQDCHVVVGPNPVAQIAQNAGPKIQGAAFIPSGAICYLGVRPGWGLAVIRDSADGSLFVTEGL